MPFPHRAVLATTVALLILAGASRADAATSVVTFDDYPEGTDVSSQYQSSRGVSFAGPSGGDGAFPQIKSAPAQARSGTQIAEVPQLSESFTSRTVGRLSPTASGVSAFVGLTAGPGGSETVTLTAFDAEGTPLASATIMAAPGEALRQVTVTSASANIASFELRGQSGGGTVGMDDLSIATADVPPPPDFSLVAPGDPATVPVGSYVDVPIVINRLNGSNGDISFSASGLPAGMSASFSPDPVSGTGTATTMRLSVAADTPPSGYTEITITGTPGAGAGATPRTARKLVRIVENCVRAIRTPYIDARTAGCFAAAGPDKLVAVNQQVRLNGLVLSPAGGSRTLVIDQRQRTISSGGDPFVVTVQGPPGLELQGVPGLRLFAGQIDWNLGGSTGDAKKVAEQFFVSQGPDDLLARSALNGLRLQRAVVSLTEAGRAEVEATLKLDFWPFNYLGALTGSAGFTTGNDRGPDFEGLELEAKQVPLLVLELRDVKIAWTQGESWRGSAVIRLPFTDAFEVGGGIGLNNGDFDYLKALVGGLNVPIAAGIFLQKIGFEVQRSAPISLAGTFGFSGGPSVAGEAAVTVDGTFKSVLSDPWVIELSGEAELAERFELGEAFVRYTSGGLLELGGKADWDLGVGYVNTQFTGFVDGSRAFSLEGSGRGCIKIPVFSDPCAGASAIVSNIGVAACVDLAVVSGGIGYYWGGSFDLFGGSCDLGRWRPVPPSSSAGGAAAGTRRVRLPAGLPSAAFAVEGAGAAPGVTLTGPRGEQISVSAARPYARSGNLVALLAENGTTYLAIRRPAGGTWTLTDDGSVAVRRVRRSFGLPKPSVSARVSGRGPRRTLSWRARPIAGQLVRFVEASRTVRRVIAATRRSSGRLAFTPADGPGGRRAIIALVEQDGLPRASIAAGSYRAPPPARPTRPRRARIARRGTSLTVSWQAARRGFRHAVHLRIGDGRSLVRVVARGRRSLTVRGVAPAYGATATITGLTRLNGRGPSVRVSIPGRPPTRPAAGLWRLAGTFGYAGSGSVGVTRRGAAVAGLRVVPGPAADPRCGRQQLQVFAERKLSPVARLGRTTWVVGRSARRAFEGVAGVAVSVRQGPTRRRGTIRLLFEGRRTGSGELRLPGCRLFFQMRAA